MQANSLSKQTPDNNIRKSKQDIWYATTSPSTNWYSPALVHHLESVGKLKVKVLEQHRNAHFRLEHRHVAAEADARPGLEGGKLVLAIFMYRGQNEGGWIGE